MIIQRALKAYLSVLLTNEALFVKRHQLILDTNACANKNVGGKPNAEKEASIAANIVSSCMHNCNHSWADFIMHFLLVRHISQPIHYFND